MAINLLQAAQVGRQDSLRAGIIDLFNEPELIRRLPVLPVEGSGIHYQQLDRLPTGMGFRGINEGLPSITPALLNPQHEGLRIYGGDLDVDLALEQMHGPEMRLQTITQQVKALSLEMTARIIQGDSTSDPKSFDGIRARIPSGSSQRIVNATNGAGLSLDKLDELLDSVDGSLGSKVLLMSPTLRRRLSAAARVVSAVGNLTYGRDELGRQYYEYNSVPIVELDYDATGSPILPFTEVCGSSSACSSIYCLSLGYGGVTLISNGGLQLRDLGELATQPVRRIRFEYLVGLAVFHPRSLARLEGITNAAVTA